MSNTAHLQARNDPLCGFFRWGRNLFPIINSHACILEGFIDPDNLYQALNRTIEQFEHLHDLFSTKRLNHNRPLSSDKLLKVVDTTFPIDFGCEDFRHQLMALAAAESKAHNRPVPILLHLIQSTQQMKSCIHLGITHDVADVKSGNIFLAGLMRAYAELNTGDSSETTPVSKTFDYPHISMDSLRPEWFTWKAPIVRWAKANLEITRRMASRNRTRIGNTVSRPEEGNETDFYHITLPNTLQDGLRQTARYYGVTLNTLFSAALVRYLDRYLACTQNQAVYTIAISLRKLLGSIYSETFRSFMIDCTLKVPFDQNDRTLLEAIQHRTTDARERGLELELGRMESAITLFKSPLPRAFVLWIMGRTQGTNVLYSNPGVVEEDFSRFGPGGPKITAMTIFGCLVPPYDLMFHTPTIGESLQLDLVYRRACFENIEKEFVDPLLFELNRMVAAAHENTPPHTAS